MHLQKCLTFGVHIRWTVFVFVFLGGVMLRGGVIALFFGGGRNFTLLRGYATPFIFFACGRHSTHPRPLPASSQSPFMLGVVGRLPPLASLPCSSFSAKRHAKVACSVVNALTTALFCYHLFAVCVLSHAFCGASPHTPLRGQAPLKPPLMRYTTLSTFPRNKLHRINPLSAFLYTKV